VGSSRYLLQVQLHLVEVSEGVSEKVEIGLDIGHQVAFNNFQILLHVLIQLHCTVIAVNIKDLLIKTKGLPHVFLWDFLQLLIH
jgi:hypothetical protein